ncbi:putative T6SS immunity periplasmic lipoprotein, partial [Snodgrassella sp. B3837]|uniref:putative T6SS immunity periplasmic lipoprotein n=1 Tax=Snodgrassella sp. B3837 TaxID=2818040 RepID=UPI00226AC830
MNKNLFRSSSLILLVILVNGCIRGYTPDIVLKKDGQPCISIPANEDFFMRKKEYSIMTTEVYQTGIGQLWEKNYFDPSKPYYVKNQECLYFNYQFQNNIFYTISFISTEKGNNENQKSTQK